MAVYFGAPGATYRSTDPIENLALQVTLRKRATEGERRMDANPPAARARTRRASLTKQQRGGDDENQASGDDADATAPLRVEREEEERLVCPPRTFRWQEKRFGPMEVRAVRREESESRSKTKRERGTGPLRLLSRSGSSLGEMLGMQGGSVHLSNHHREVFRRLESEAAERGEEYQGDVLFSRVHAEGYIDPREAASKLTDSSYEVLTPLARSVLSGAMLQQHRDVLGEAACVSMHIFAALPATEVADALDAATPAGTSAPSTPRGGATSTNPPSRAASLTRRRGPRDDEPREGEAQLSEVLLCVLRLYPGGRLDIKPSLSYDGAGSADEAAAERVARWYAVPGSRYEYMLENVAEGLSSKQGEYEAVSERVAKLSLSAQSAVSRPSVPELDFVGPPRKAARVVHFIELVSAEGFGPVPLYIAYYALAAPGWRLLPHCVASAVTQTSIVHGAHQRAVFGFPIELALESDGPPSAARPPLSLFLSIVSRDAHERMTQLGYAHIAPPAVAGYTESELGAWRLAESRTDALRRFFVGGTEELRDLRALDVPEGFDVSKPAVLNKHGLQTVTAGRVRVQIHTVVQQQQPAAASKAPAKAKADATRRDFGRPKPELGTLKGVLNVSTLARAETAVDRVKKRLDERRRLEGS